MDQLKDAWEQDKDKVLPFLKERGPLYLVAIGTSIILYVGILFFQPGRHSDIIDPKQTGEKIPDFVTEMYIDRSGAVTVKERLQLVSNGQIIQKGMKRGFPGKLIPSDVAQKIAHSEIKKDAIDKKTLSPLSYIALRGNMDGDEISASFTQNDDNWLLQIGPENLQIPIGKHEFLVEYKEEKKIKKLLKFRHSNKYTTFCCCIFIFFRFRLIQLNNKIMHF